jgi:tRNA (guanine37-N1)-methyltransferase
MKFHILTLFPDMFLPIKTSILARAESKGLIEINLINFREFSTERHKKVDDYPYGGGNGMLLTCQPIYDAINSIDPTRKMHRIFVSPKGNIFNEEKAKQLAGLNGDISKDIIILCGHYEGVDQRVIDLCIDEEISIGNFVLTGGEIAAMAIIDAVARLLPGVLNAKEAYEKESHFNGFLEEPQYTKPREFMGLKVPDVLISGNHAEIEKWQIKNRKPIK